MADDPTSSTPGGPVRRFLRRTAAHLRSSTPNTPIPISSTEPDRSADDGKAGHEAAVNAQLMDILRKQAATNPRIAALTEQVENIQRRRAERMAQLAPNATPPQQQEPPRPQAIDALHGHQITRSDAAMIRMLAGASFGPDATVTLPSGITVTGTEMQRWVEANPDA